MSKGWDLCSSGPLKGFKGAGGYSQICILGSFWRIYCKEERLEGGNQLGDKCNDLG